MWLIIDCWPGTSLMPAITLFSHGILSRKELSVVSQGLSCLQPLQGVRPRAAVTPELLCPLMWQGSFVFFLKSKFLIDERKSEMKRVVREDEKRLLWPLHSWGPRYYSHKLCSVVLSIAEGQVEPRDRSERTNINSESKETQLSVKWSVWAGYSVERESVLLRKCLHVVVSQCGCWV